MGWAGGTGYGQAPSGDMGVPPRGGAWRGQCETDWLSGEPLDKLSPEALNFCRAVGSQASTVTEVVRLRDPLVYTAIQQGIDAVNAEAISNAQKIRKWLILEKDFSIVTGELGERGARPWLVSGSPWAPNGRILYYKGTGGRETDAATFSGWASSSVTTDSSWCCVLPLEVRFELLPAALHRTPCPLSPPVDAACSSPGSVQSQVLGTCSPSASNTLLLAVQASSCKLPADSGPSLPMLA